MVYNTGNYKKYTTKNPLKRKMVENLNARILEIVKDTISGFDKPAGERVSILDAGCGEGFVVNLLCQNLDGGIAGICGLELTEEALDIAREKNPGISFVQGDICKMPFESGTFDIVLCTEVLEHLENPSEALSELMRVSKGAVIVTVPHEPWFCMGNLLVLKNVTRLGNPIDHINHWTYQGFQAFLRGNTCVEWKMKKSFPWTIAHCRIDNEADN